MNQTDIEIITQEIEPKFCLSEFSDLGLKKFASDANHGQFYFAIGVLGRVRYGLVHFLNQEWYQKKGLKSLDFPRQTKNLEKLGIFNSTIFKLCEQCYRSENLTDDNGTEIYWSAGEWFVAIVREAKAAQIRAIQNDPVIYTKSPKVTKPMGKDKLAKQEGQYWKKLANKKNIFKPVPDQIHRYRLIETSIKFSKNYKFEKEYWTPHIRAGRAWLRYRRRNKEFKHHYIEENAQGQKSIRIQQGQGKHKLYFPF